MEQPALNGASTLDASRNLQRMAPDGPYVLVVDDQQVVRDFLKRSLEGSGFAVKQAGSALIALELMVLPGYLLAAYHKSDAYSTEGAIKYFLLGSFSSAIFLFGLAFVWGLTGSTRVADIANALTTVATTPGAFSPGLAMGFAFLTTGVAFKIAAVPFHYWTPDAYQGSPTPVTGYLSVGPKIGAFALILRLFVEALAPLKGDWLPIVIVLAALTMTVGNLVALTQDNVKRMLAYSSIAHTGYMLVGLAAFGAGQIGGRQVQFFEQPARAGVDATKARARNDERRRQTVMIVERPELREVADLGRSADIRHRRNDRTLYDRPQQHVRAEAREASPFSRAHGIFRANTVACTIRDLEYK